MPPSSQRFTFRSTIVATAVFSALSLVHVPFYCLATVRFLALLRDTVVITSFDVSMALQNVVSLDRLEVVESW